MTFQKMSLSTARLIKKLRHPLIGLIIGLLAGLIAELVIKAIWKKAFSYLPADFSFFGALIGFLLKLAKDKKR